MSIKTKKYLAMMLSVLLLMTTVLAENLLDIAAGSSQLAIKESAGYEEGAYAEWETVTGADGYRAYVSSDGTNYTPIDDMLIREYSDYWRVDAVGLKAGTYSIKIEAVKVNNDNTTSVLAESVAENLSVVNYDRSGFAFSSDSPLKTGSGAYNDDGTLKSGAQVVYVTPQTAKTCTAKVKGVVVTGFQAILDAKQSAGTSGDIIDFRIIGCIKKDDLDKISSSKEGLQVKGKAAYTAMNITIEGIGEDACISGFGMILRNCGNVELRNFGVINFMDDGISLDTDNCNIWVHDLDIFYGTPGSDSDQAKGDGSVDIKEKSTYITVSYVHFWDSGKCSLCGMKDTEEFMVTYHHNWFDHSDSRHARIRVATVHMYNNYFDGNSKYGVGVTKGSSAFVENNYFRNCKYPMMSSMQGTDKDVVIASTGSGIFSNEDGGMIKAYNNKIEGATALTYANAATRAGNATSFDAYLASSRNEQVPASYKTLQGGTTYNNFDTSSSYDLGVEEAAIDSPEAAKANVMSKAGRLSGGDLKFTFTDADDTSYDVNSGLKAAINGYQSSVKAIGGLNKAGTTTPPETEPESGSQQGSESGSQQGSESGSDVTPSGGSHVLNITTDGTDSTYFSFPGTKKNMSDSKGTVQYNGLTLTKCLKMESGTQVQFANSSDAKLVLVFGGSTSAAGKSVKIDGTKYEADSNSIVTVDVAAGTHIIEKADSINLFYIEVIEKGAEKPSESESASQPSESESESKPSESESESKPSESESDLQPNESQSETGSAGEEGSGADSTAAASDNGNEGGSSSNGGAETGDGNTALLWMFIALLSGVGAVYVEKKTRKAN